MESVRTRIAPSPTGDDLHVGNAYAALINYVFAKKNQGEFIIRIEDTDRTRLVAGSQKRILESLSWLGISHDEGPDIGGKFAPYEQSKRLDIYKTYAQKLVAAGHAYYCFCTPERLERMRRDQQAQHLSPMYDGSCKKLDPLRAAARVKAGERYVVRLNVPDTGITSFHDLIRGDVSFENQLIDDQVILKSDGYPTYHLGVVVDDYLMGITHVIRGEEWLSSIPKHLLLYRDFGWPLPQFAHLPLLRNPDKSKMSKRKNPVWVLWYRQQGFLPQVMLNYLGTMGWAFPGGRDIFTLEEMIENFSLENIRTSAPIFDFEKLRWMNGEYLRKMSDAELEAVLWAFDKRIPRDSRLIRRILPLVKERMKTLAEFWSLAAFLFEKPKVTERELDPQKLKLLVGALDSGAWTRARMEPALRAAADRAGIKAKDLFMELRVAVTGKTVGPPLLESLEILGRQETLSRLK